MKRLKISLLFLILFFITINLTDRGLNSKRPLFKGLSQIDHIIFSTDYEWKGNGSESKILSLLGTVERVEIAEKENLTQWTLEEPVKITLLKEGKQIYQISIYKPLDNPIGRSEGLILEWKDKLYLLPQIDWTEFLSLCQENRGLENLNPNLKGRDIVFYHIYALRKGPEAGEYQYTLEKDLQGEWQLTLAGVQIPEDITLNLSEVNLLMGELGLWRGKKVPYEKEQNNDIIYTIEVRDTLGRRYEWLVKRSSEEGFFLVSTPSEQRSYLLSQDELKRVSPPVSRLLN
jgi:hypothetical protein